MSDAPLPLPPEPLPTAESEMVAHHTGDDAARVRAGAWWSRWYLLPFFRRIAVEGHAVEALRELAHNGTLVYLSTELGTIECQYFSSLFHNERLPQPQWINELAPLNPRWSERLPPLPAPWRRRLANLPKWPHRASADDPAQAIRSGHVQSLLRAGHSALFRIRTTALYDDLLWDDPQEDPLIPLVAAQQETTTPFWLVPLHFQWDRRPERSAPNLVDLLLGEGHRPGTLRQLYTIATQWWRRPVALLGTPINVQTFLDSRVGASAPAVARDLRAHLLDLMRGERKGLTGPPLKPRRWMCDQALQSEEVQRTLYPLAAERGTFVEDLQLLAKRYAREISADVNYTVVEIMRRLIRWVLSHMYDSIDFSPEDLASVRKALEAGPVILAPNHRSHIDYLLLSTLLYENNIALPYGAGGINLAFWPFGWIARRCGAFFLRRTFEGNPLYRAVFAAYLRLLVREGHCVEFFIEGGRSRTGKSLPARMGILSMLVDTMREQVVPELRFIPISITYDQVIEQRAYLTELHGTPKRKEKGWDLLRLGKYLRRRYGRIYLKFGEPVSFWETVGTPITDGVTKRAATQQLAITLMRAIHRGLVVTPAALTATALLLHPGRAVAETEVLDTSARLLDYLRWRETPTSELLAHDPERACRGALDRFTDGHLIQRHAAFPPTCYAVESGKRLELDYSKNTSLHAFVSIACLAVILRAAFARGETHPTIERIAADFSQCQQLFRYEFTFATRLPLREHLARNVAYLQERGILADCPHDETVQVTLHTHHQLRLFALLLRNYFEAYKTALLTCHQIPSEGIEERSLTKLMLNYGRHLLLLGSIRCPEAITHSNFSNAIRTLADYGILQPVEPAPNRRGKWWRFQADLEAVHTLQRTLEEWC
ncbi:MAG: 1-acyl-sn-glycerol-3-phosphate acyltransferase [Deltaproteobacteria bacterium]|nr:1-acyl-sn-glycerol-3-phosphate acyltransferase [Deltaproteobacteria bacterium]